MSSLVIQSYKTTGVPSWIETCLVSVEQWSDLNGYDYQFVDDDIFDLVPKWYLEKIEDKMPIATDYARLILLQKALESGRYEQAIWLDADVLVFDQSLHFDFSGSCAFGQELWIQYHGSRYRTHTNVHNAVCIFKRGCPVLPFLIQTVASIIRRVDSEKISPQMVGPKLLTALHNIAGFSLLPQIGALSPALLVDLASGEGKALDLYQLKCRERGHFKLQAANLCASVVSDKVAKDAVQHLMNNQRLI